VPPQGVADGGARAPEFRGDLAPVDVGGLAQDRGKPPGPDLLGFRDALTGRKPFAVGFAGQPVRKRVAADPEQFSGLALAEPRFEPGQDQLPESDFV